MQPRCGSGDKPPRSEVGIFNVHWCEEGRDSGEEQLSGSSEVADSLLHIRTWRL